MAITEIPEAQASAELDETRCVDALRHLEQLQDQLDELRLAIPRIIQPLRVNQPSPAALVNGFRKAAEAASKDLNNFKLAWQSEETQTIFKWAKESYEKEHDLSTSVRVPKYGWTSHSQLPEAVSKEPEPQHSTDLEAIPEPNKPTVDVKQCLDDFGSAHPDFAVSTESDNQIIKIQFKVPSMILKFIITRRKKASDKESLEAECVGNMRLFAAITRCITARPDPDDLRYLLDMIAAYKNVREASCSRCGKMLDDTALTPAARRLDDNNTNETDKPMEWQAFHESCLAASDSASSSKAPPA